MRYSVIIRPKIEELSDTAHVAQLIQNKIRRYKKSWAGESCVFIAHEIQFFNQDADNILHNRVTIRVQGQAYKAPRIAIRANR